MASGRLYNETLKRGVFDIVESNAPFIIGRVYEGVETSHRITEFAAIRILDPHAHDGETMSMVHHAHLGQVACALALWYNP